MSEVTCLCPITAMEQPAAASRSSTALSVFSSIRSTMAAALAVARLSTQSKAQTGRQQRAGGSAAGVGAAGWAEQRSQ